MVGVSGSASLAVADPAPGALAYFVIVGTDGTRADGRQNVGLLQPCAHRPRLLIGTENLLRLRIFRLNHKLEVRAG